MDQSSEPPLAGAGILKVVHVLSCFKIRYSFWSVNVELGMSRNSCKLAKTIAFANLH